MISESAVDLGQKIRPTEVFTERSVSPSFLDEWEFPFLSGCVIFKKIIISLIDVQNVF